MEQRIGWVGALLPSAKALSGQRKQTPRSEPRYKVRLCSGLITDHRFREICHCVIRDRSQKGARLLLPPNINVPGLFYFRDDDLGVYFRAEVRWRRDREMGIRKLYTL